MPWTDTLFQYTVKDVARPAAGTVWLDGIEHEVPAGDSWATLDHGRGRWPYAVAWNWGAGSGVVDGRTIGIQVGGRWTDGTGSVENALVVDAGEKIRLADVIGWAEAVRRRLAVRTGDQGRYRQRLRRQRDGEGTSLVRCRLTPAARMSELGDRWTA